MFEVNQPASWSGTKNDAYSCSDVTAIDPDLRELRRELRQRHDVRNQLGGGCSHFTQRDARFTELGISFNGPGTDTEPGCDSNSCS